MTDDENDDSDTVVAKAITVAMIMTAVTSNSDNNGVTVCIFHCCFVTC